MVPADAFGPTWDHSHMTANQTLNQGAKAMTLRMTCELALMI